MVDTKSQAATRRQRKMVVESAGGLDAIGVVSGNRQRLVATGTRPQCVDGQSITSSGQRQRAPGLFRFVSLLKSGSNGTFHDTSEGHLHRYCAEFEFRYNNRVAPRHRRTDR